MASVHEQYIGAEVFYECSRPACPVLNHRSVHSGVQMISSYVSNFSNPPSWTQCDCQLCGSHCLMLTEYLRVFLVAQSFSFHCSASGSKTGTALQVAAGSFALPAGYLLVHLGCAVCVYRRQHLRARRDNFKPRRPRIL
ncbi:hypothetical protein OBBRIDRAFT_261585 [Obba rivulosa]|uniref:Uncharacterized protein n=1 Tax=Obba rivulosa TaxID=1052685 RepID=A0A8E2AKB9_9APHY|nr:hypothetical protein OBBRIDRAFT_261585 [Obba rivulosa]